MTVRQTNLESIRQHSYLTVLLTIKYSKKKKNQITFTRERSTGVSKAVSFEVSEHLTSLITYFPSDTVVGFGEKIGSKTD